VLARCGFFLLAQAARSCLCLRLPLGAQSLLFDLFVLLHLARHALVSFLRGTTTSLFLGAQVATTAAATISATCCARLLLGLQARCQGRVGIEGHGHFECLACTGIGLLLLGCPRSRRS
jgi:hypothetical protein